MPKKWNVTRAVRDSDLPAPARLVMFVLADSAHVDTWEIPERHTPSLTDLGKETGLDRRTVTRHMEQLVADGWIIRTTPTQEEMIRGGRNRYRLAIPGVDAAPENTSPDLGAEDPYLGAEDPQGRGTESPDLGAERPYPRGAAPPPYKEVRSTTDQSDPFGGTPPASAANGKVSEETTQTILAGFIDFCAARDVNIKSLRGQYAKTIKEALDAGHKPNFVKTVLARMLDDKIANRPSLLRNRLVEAQTGPERPRQPPGNQPYRDQEQGDYEWKAPNR